MRLFLKLGSIYFPLLVEYFSRAKSFLLKRTFRQNLISVINTHDQGGGAAKIAYNLVKNSAYSSSIKFFVQEKRINHSQIIQIPKSQDTRIQRWLDEMERLGGWLDICKITPLNLLKTPFFNSSKIVHLHNLHGNYFSYAILPALVRKRKVIWTLHDEQLLTGHCSCTLGCERWKIGCGNCPHLDTYPAIKVDNTLKLLAYKIKWLKQINPIIVCPSNWLAKRVNLAFPFLKDVLVIPNGVDIQIFKPTLNKEELRKKLNLPANAFLILFAAELSTKNPFKGGEIIDQILKQDLDETTYVVTIGGETVKQSIHHIPFGYIDDERKMADLYAVSDVMIYPTRADNLPLVVLEAMSCGLPVIASNLGGISEIIKHGKNGYLVDDYFAKEAFQDFITVFKDFPLEQKRFIAENARRTIEESFSIVQMTEAYDKIYSDHF